MLTFLSGGTGTPKLLRGMRTQREDPDLCIIVNTAEDLWLSGNHLSPDIDTVLYLFAGLLNTETWWGIAGDTFETHDFLRNLGGEEFIAVGDRDRAVHIARGALLRQGFTLTDATKKLSTMLGIDAGILPMTDSAISTYVTSKAGDLHFQEYWVKYRGAVDIEGVTWQYETSPQATPDVLSALKASEAVVIGPSNPVTSITPILSCTGVRDALRDQFVIAISPFIGDAPVSGPAKALMEAFGCDPSSRGTYALYSDFVDIFVQDTRDPRPLEGAVRLDTLMVNEKASVHLAGSIESIIRHHGEG